MIIGDSIRKYEREIVHHIQELIRIRSVASEPLPGKPFGEGVDKALSYMLELGASMGFAVKNVDGYAGHAEYGTGEELTAVLVHLDTVPEGSGWSCGPFDAEIHEGKIYGRGASDNKGPAVIALFALKALKDSGIVPERRIRIIFGTNEENGMTDMDHYFAKEPLPDYGFTPDACYPIINAEKGAYVIKLKQSRKAARHQTRLLTIAGGTAANVVPELCRALLSLEEDGEAELARIRLLAETNSQIELGSMNGPVLEIMAAGKTAHGASPSAGINAVAHMVDFLMQISDISSDEDFLRFIQEAIGFETFGESLGIACSDPVHGELTLNLAKIRLDEREAEVTLNIRHPVTISGEDVLAKLRQRVGHAGIEMEVAGYNQALFVAPDHPLIRMLSRAYEGVTGKPTELLSIGGGTYAKKMQNRGVAFGAGVGGGAHQPDEFIPIAEMMDHGVICLQAIFELSYLEK
ncbi:dipeptidase PepV [Paenibacillus montanisoli]|uniref:Dipeptidase PepV n=1 Tax=Paenibacillus montanisoli TaxID=2081970 RepID=A0A328U522_9BACL|nr:dipeptidase PepV [Paenibacillus montanisoli]RAP77907.1 dipeptidase PepV [Paenibacillus montanisoli]